MSIGSWNKVKTHVFEFDGDIVAFDIYRSRPYLAEPVDKAVLRLRAPINEQEAIQQLRGKFSAEILQDSFQRLASWGLIQPLDEPFPINPLEPDFPEITTLEFNIAEDCNLRCTYCCVDQGGFGADQGSGRVRGIMSWEVARKAIDLLFREAVQGEGVHIRFFGGEPLMNWPVIEKSVLYTEEKAKQNGKRTSFSIVVNGTLLNKDIIQFMQEHKFWVQLSVDGTPEMHDAFRVDTEGKGSYTRAVKHLPDLLEALGPRGVHGRGTLTHFDPDVMKAFKHMRALGLNSPEIRPVTGHAPDYGMTVSDYKEYCRGLSELARSILTSKPGEAGQYFTIFHGYVDQLMRHSPRRPPCAAGRAMIGVSIDGNLYPCTDMVGKEHEALQFGDIYNGLKRDRQKTFLEIVDVDNKEGCRSCWARYVCGGACASAQFRNEGGLEQNAGLECIWVRHAIQLSLWLYVKMLAERPDIFYELYGEEIGLNLGPLAEVLSLG